MEGEALPVGVGKEDAGVGEGTATSQRGSHGHASECGRTCAGMGEGAAAGHGGSGAAYAMERATAAHTMEGARGERANLLRIRKWRIFFNKEQMSGGGASDVSDVW